MIAGSGPYANDELCRDFVENLVGLRTRLGWSQEKLAAESHVGKGVIAMTESYQRKPQVDHGRFTFSNEPEGSEVGMSPAGSSSASTTTGMG